MQMSLTSGLVMQLKNSLTLGPLSMDSIDSPVSSNILTAFSLLRGGVEHLTAIASSAVPYAHALIKVSAF